MKTSAGVTYSAFTGWSDEPTDIATPFRGDIRCDVAVVGGGLAGMATALRLAERGVDVVLLESGYCGWGASSRNAGYLSNELAGEAEVLQFFYKNKLKNLTRFAENSAQFTEGLIERFDIDCDYEATGNIKAAISEAQLGRLRRNAEILQEAGSNIEFGDGAQLGLPSTFLGGIFVRGGGLMNPGRFTAGIRSALLASGARVFERTTVRSVEPNGARVTVEVPSGRVDAERVVLATNANTRELTIGPSGVGPVYTSVVETDPVDPEALEAIGWTTRAGIVTPHQILENYRRTPRGTLLYGTRRLRGAPSGPLGAQAPDPAVVDDLTRGFHQRFPTLNYLAPQRAWGGWIAMTSFLPVAGEVAKNVFYGVSCNGHGLAQSPYLGTLLADRLAGDDPHDDLQTLWRPRPPRLPSFVLSTPVFEAGWAVDRLTDRFGI
ncbi:NAD(P)/FAD-dependent oxidoreductase [Tsukamurella pseudospumae]|uniref:Oxidoreductase n=1 Tax=Tsukamurella pseudospumae TaxID=239498 RepID=A0A138A8S0_9ACTN|nr:FAD-binding oxidoreductase [Tsukamurella pseudospumae]KXP06856.1 oxidoreductase [Tsukamurella pseudospumae]